MTTKDSLAGDSNERHWNRGSFVTLGFAALMIVFNLGQAFYFWSLPSDGWAVSTEDASQEYSAYLEIEIVDLGTDLQSGDQVLAINGEPVTALADKAYSFYEVVPPDWPDGTVLTYDILRDGAPLSVEVAIRRLAPVQILSSTFLGAGTGSDWLRALITVAGPAVFFAVGLAVFLMRPGSRAAHALFLIGSAFVFNLVPALPSLPTLFYPMTPSSVPFDTWTAFINPSLVYLALVFPRPKWLLSRFWPGSVVLIYLPWLLIFNIVYLYNLHDRAGYYQTAQVIYVVQIVLLMTVTLASLVHTALTERDPVARSQFKWIALGMSSFVFFGVGGWLLGNLILGGTTTLLGSVVYIIGQLGWFLFPITVGIAILRYRLFDIDVIIRRTTSYAILSGILLLVYFGSIVVLQRLLSPLTGNSQAAIVLSTLLIAALFLPLRRRVQDSIDRRFFRKKYDAEQVLAQFAATVRDETDLDALTAELVRVIQETMQPEFVSVWLKEPDK
jgi:hypothetical protein